MEPVVKCQKSQLVQTRVELAERGQKLSWLAQRYSEKNPTIGRFDGTSRITVPAYTVLCVLALHFDSFGPNQGSKKRKKRDS